MAPESVEADYFARQGEVEKHALELYGSDKAAAVAYLNAYSNDKAQQMLAHWRDLATLIIVKYNDMAVKRTKDGKLTRYVDGYPEAFAKKLVKEKGDWYESK